MAMKVSPYTTSYNDQFRNKDNVLSPNAGEPMYHFPGYYDPSHYQKDAGFYGTRAALTKAAKEAAAASGQQVRLPQPNDGPVGFGEAPRRSDEARRIHSFYAPPPEASTQNYSALRQQSIEGLNTMRVPLDPAGRFGSSMQQQLGDAVNGASRSQPLPAAGLGAAGQSSSPSHFGRSSGVYGGVAYGDKDLWTHPVLPHTDPSTYGSPMQGTRGAGFMGYTMSSRPQSANGQMHSTFGVTNGAQSARFGVMTAPRSSSSIGGGSGSIAGFQPGGPLVGLVDPAFVDAPDGWRYDARGVAQTKEVALARNTDPRQRYCIPGYAGFIRGKQHLYGQTFGKMTREALDIPLDLPTDIDQ